MPEEINRVLTDRVSDLLFTPSRDAGDNLLAEGIPRERVHFVGNIMIDSLVALLPEARRRNGAGPAGAAAPPRRGGAPPPPPPRGGAAPPPPPPPPPGGRHG